MTLRSRIRTRPLRTTAALLALLAGCVAERPDDRRDDPGATAAAAAVADTASQLELRFLDVGQGDAVLVRASGRAVLVDAGPSDRVVARLRELGVEKLDLLLASHNHSDHIGGMDAVLDSLPVRNYLDNGHPAGTDIQKRILRRLEEKSVTYLEATPRTVSLGDTRLRIVPSPVRERGDEQNDRSVVVIVERGRFRALLSGDSEEPEIRALLAPGTDLPDVDVLKAAHHGSHNGVTREWLARLRPEVVVISAGKANNYGHPHREALQLYCTEGRQVLRTDLHGEVVVEVSAGGAYATWAEGDARAVEPSAQQQACARTGTRRRR